MTNLGSYSTVYTLIMAVVIDHFQALKEQYPTWPELKEFLTSNRLRVVEPDNTSNLAVIRYVKGESDLVKYGHFRSVVWNTVDNSPVCVAPVKSSDEHIPPLLIPFASVQDFVDGVMLQAFVTQKEPTVLRLATRTQIGAMNTFYSQKTFGEMFTECLLSTPVRTQDMLLMHLRELMSTTSSTAVFASFVIQHPDHRIVVKVESPDLNMVHLGTVSASGKVAIMEQSVEWPSPLRRLQIPTYPMKMFKDEEEIKLLMRRTAVQNGFRWQGLVFKDGTGSRWRMRSTGYTTLRTLRGAEAKSVDRFLRLRREGKVVEYLKHYSEDRAEFWNFETQLRARTNDILLAYNAVHKAHLMKFAELPQGYKPGVHLLHVTYLTVLREQKLKVTLGDAIRTVNGLKEFEQRRLIEMEAFKAPEAPKAVIDCECSQPCETSSAKVESTQ